MTKDELTKILLGFADHLETYKGLEEIIRFDFMVNDYLDKLEQAGIYSHVVRPASAGGSEGEPLSAEGEEKQVKITLHEYAYHCGDGCCFNYGTITTVNGVQMEAHNTDVQTILQQVLTHLGYSVEIETTYDKE